MDTLFERLLREKIRLMIDMRTQNLVGPGITEGVTSFDQYTRAAGYIQALHDVLGAMEEIKERED
jgi:hypothetical protein